MIWGGADVIIIEIKCIINVMHLNHPETIPHPSCSMEKLSSTKPVPGAEKVGDPCPKHLPGIQALSWVWRRHEVQSLASCVAQQWNELLLKSAFSRFKSCLHQESLCSSGSSFMSLMLYFFTCKMWMETAHRRLTFWLVSLLLSFSR